MKEETIKQIFSKINIEIKRIEFATNSYNSNVYIVEDDSDRKYIFKIANNKIKRLNECKYYNYLYNYVPTSKVLVSGSVLNEEYNIITFLEGKNMADEDCNSLSENDIYNIGSLLGKIHSCEIIEEDNDSWINYLKNCLKISQSKLVQVFGEEDNELIYSYLNNFIDENIKNNYTNNILHMDYRIGNVIIQDDGTVGVIDLESMKNGDYVFDFVKMNRIFTKENFNIFLKGYEKIRNIGDDFDIKLDFYSMFDSYTSLLWCINKNQLNTDFYNINYSISMKFLEKIKNGEWKYESSTNKSRNV